MKTLTVAMLAAVTLAGCVDVPVYERTSGYYEPAQVYYAPPRVVYAAAPVVYERTTVIREPVRVIHEPPRVVHGNALPARHHDRDRDSR